MALEVGKICKLDEVVINRIAAGEVVQRPCNAIKELVENSIDAGSDSITVSVDDGGLKMLQITDTGHGIRKEDLGIVCERFTTSKLKTFSDLRSISTHGFRGEALASISHVSFVTIQTKTAFDKCAWVGHYRDGKLHPKKPGASAEPKPCAGNTGTTITAEDLFYNMGTRKRAMNGRDEFNKVAHVITCYAIHNTGTAFSLKKSGDNMPKIRTTSKATKIDTISNLYGPSLGKELIEFSCDDKNFGFKSSGYLTNANYSGKSFRFILFINNRLVESSAAKKAFEAVYASVLPKNSYPFVYLSIHIDPQNIDVNVHPTKNEVHFLHEDEIIAGIQAKAQQTLYQCSTSRNYYTQARLPGFDMAAAVEEVKGKKKAVEGSESSRVYDHQLVRTDCNQTKLDLFIANQANRTEEKKNAKSNPSASSSSGLFSTVVEDRPGPSHKEVIGSSASSENKENINTINVEEFVPKEAPKPGNPTHRRPIYLTSVLNLQEDICKARHEGAVDLMREHKFVGVANSQYALAQVKTKLYLFDFGKLSEALFYQKVIFDFQNFDIFNFSEAAPIHDLVMIALDDESSSWNPDHGPKEELATFATELLLSKREMLDDYFSIVITEEGSLSGLPMLVEQYYPLLHQIPMFLLRLATEVDWESEKGCFQTVAMEIARLYTMKPLERENEDGATQSTQKDPTDPNVPDWKFTVEHILFPQFKSFFIPDMSVTSSGAVLQVADLHDLYKVFERC
ncbi:hypothetical protein ACHWQZ_G011601 [Mnemiopsis leidyi]